VNLDAGNHLRCWINNYHILANVSK
jgi:hypothetical protein